MKFINAILIFLSALIAVDLYAQEGSAFRINLEPVRINDFNGLYSYAWAKAADKLK